jgi:hypothetical protein
MKTRAAGRCDATRAQRKTMGQQAGNNAEQGGWELLRMSACRSLLISRARHGRSARRPERNAFVVCRSLLIQGFAWHTRAWPAGRAATYGAYAARSARRSCGSAKQTHLLPCNTGGGGREVGALYFPVNSTRGRHAFGSAAGSGRCRCLQIVADSEFRALAEGAGTGSLARSPHPPPPSAATLPSGGR